MKSFFSLFLIGLFFGGFLMKTGIYGQEINLAEMQKKEEERRKKIEKSKVSVNDSNLGKKIAGAKSSGSVEVQPLSLDTSETANQKNVSEQIDQQKKEEYWRGEKQRLENLVRELKEKIQKEELDLNKLWTDWRLQDNPVIKGNIMESINKLTHEKELHQGQLKEAEKNLAELPDRARRAGVPPGWVR